MSRGLQLYIDFIVFVFGAVLGSFLNVCIHRMPRGESIVSPPSSCPHCGTHIRWYHNIPLVTYLAIGGKCRYCGAKITPRYFVVELLTAIAFLVLWLRFDGWLAPIYWVLFAGFVVATFIDCEHFIIPDEITLGGIVVGVVLSLAYPPLMGKTTAAEAGIQSLLGALCGGALLYAVVEGGKLLFGKLHLSLHPQSQIIIADGRIEYDLPSFIERSKLQVFGFALFTMLQRLLPSSRILRRSFLRFTRKHCPAVRYPRKHEEVRFDEIFSRDSDRINFYAQRIKCGEREFESVHVFISPVSITIGKESFELVTIGSVLANSDMITLPREAMGFGDVKLLAAIGAFLGWEATLFTVVFSSVMGSLGGVIGIALRRLHLETRIPYGPYLVAAAVLWIFYGPPIELLYMRIIGR